MDEPDGQKIAISAAVQVFLDMFPQLVGTKFGELVYRFSDGLVLGLLNRRSGACDIAPPAETVVRRPLRLPNGCLHKKSGPALRSSSLVA